MALKDNIDAVGKLIPILDKYKWGATIVAIVAVGYFSHSAGVSAGEKSCDDTQRENTTLTAENREYRENMMASNNAFLQERGINVKLKDSIRQKDELIRYGNSTFDSIAAQKLREAARPLINKTKKLIR